VSRTKGGSRNRVKAVRRLSREHARIANQRRSFLHEVSSQLAKTHAKLVVEDLNLRSPAQLQGRLVGWRTDAL
jgi:putative transposase